MHLSWSLQRLREQHQREHAILSSRAQQSQEHMALPVCVTDLGAGVGPSASQVQPAVKPGANCNSKAGSGSKSVRKQTVFGKMRGKMKDTIT